MAEKSRLKRWWNFFFPGYSSAIAPVGEANGNSRASLDGIHPLDAYQKVSVVRQCVSLISKQVATFPLKFQVRANRNNVSFWKDAVSHHAWQFITGSPNEYMTNVDFRRSLLVNYLLWGNAYARIFWDEDTGRIKEVWPLRSDFVSVQWDKTRKSITYKTPFIDGDGFPTNDKKITLMPYEVLHIKNLSTSGLYGISPITAAIVDIDGEIVARDYQRRNLEKAIPAGIISMSEEGNDENYKSEVQVWNKGNSGYKNLGIVALGPAMQFETVQIPQGDKAWLESRELVTKDISAYYHVPLHKLNRMEQSTFGNLAQENKDFIDTCLQSGMTDFEQAYVKAFLFPREIRLNRYRIWHDVSTYLRADPMQRSEIARNHVNTGIKNRNEIRVEEGLEPFDGGNVHTVQVNMTDINNLPNMQVEKT